MAELNFEDIKTGEFFTIGETPSYPKLKTHYGYIDFRDEIKVSSDKVYRQWPFTIMTLEEVQKQLAKYNMSEHDILLEKERLLTNDIVYDLTEAEEKLIPVFVRGLSKKIGKENAVTSTTIMKKIPGLNGARVRKIINYIRNNYLVPGLIATSSGYYVTKDREELKEYINSLGHREAAIYSIRKKMEEYLKTLN